MARHGIKIRITITLVIEQLQLIKYMSKSTIYHELVCCHVIPIQIRTGLFQAVKMTAFRQYRYNTHIYIYTGSEGGGKHNND